MVTSISWEGSEELSRLWPEEKWDVGEGFACGGNGLSVGMNNGAQVERSVPCRGLFPYFHQSAKREICLHLDLGHKLNTRGQISLSNKRAHGNEGGRFIF